MDDLISRQAAIEAVNAHYDDEYFNFYTVMDILKQLPSAQPETHEERTETHGVCLDAIDRQAAIDALQDRYKLYSWDDGGAQKAEIGRIIREIYDMSSAQPTGTPLHDNGSDYAHGFADGYKQGLKDAESERVRCKNCKHWKDSDGVYRRGIGAESKCPVNIRAVYEGNFYCADAERRTDEA